MQKQNKKYNDSIVYSGRGRTIEQNNKKVPKNEFRYNYNTKHTNFVFEDDGKNYHSLGVTHHAKTFGKNNMPLSFNPKKGRSEKSYIRNGIVTDKKSNYSKIDNRFSFSKEDYPNVKSKIRNYKNYRRKMK